MKKIYLKPKSGIWFYLQYMVYLQWIWFWPVDLFPDWSPPLSYMADGTARYAEKVGYTQQPTI